MNIQTQIECSKCGLLQSTDEFYKNNLVCNDCVNKRKRELRKLYPERYRGHSRRWRKNNREAARAQSLKWTKTEKGRAILLRGSKKYQDNNKEKVQAQRLIHYALKRGEMVRPKCCEKCLLEKRLHGHHDDYNKPLEVRWLCAQCHAEVHTLLVEKDQAALKGSGSSRIHRTRIEKGILAICSE